jgi:hypothetical protein
MMPRREKRETRQRTARKQVEDAKDPTLLALKQLGQL